MSKHDKLQDSKEVTMRAIEFAGPERIPIEVLSNPTESDVVLVGSAPSYWRWEQVSPGVEECVDENGCLRRRLNGATLGEVINSPLQDESLIASFKFPQRPDSWRADTSQLVSQFTDKYVMGDLGLALYTVVDMRRIDNFLCDVALESTELQRLLDLVLDEKLAQIRGYASIEGIQAVAWYDDWGIQDRLLISPHSWRRLFKPRYEHLISEAHRHSIHVYWHCCGYIWDILPDMVEIGVNIINLDQPTLMGIERLAEHYAGKVCFSCPVDIQATLPKGDIAAVEQEARLLIEQFGRFSGGFIGKICEGIHTDLAHGSSVIEAYEQVMRSYRYA